MTLPKLEKWEIQKVLGNALGESNLEGSILLGQSFMFNRNFLEECDVPVAGIPLTPEYLAEVANQALDKAGYSERYTPEDFSHFSQIMGYIPRDLPQDKGKLLCDVMREAYSDLVLKKVNKK